MPCSGMFDKPSSNKNIHSEDFSQGKYFSLYFFQAIYTGSIYAASGFIFYSIRSIKDIRYSKAEFPYIYRNLDY